MGLFGINSEDGEGVRKPEYITLRQAICSDDCVQMYEFNGANMSFQDQEEDIGADRPVARILLSL